MRSTFVPLFMVASLLGILFYGAIQRERTTNPFLSAPVVQVQPTQNYNPVPQSTPVIQVINAPTNNPIDEFATQFATYAPQVTPSPSVQELATKLAFEKYVDVCNPNGAKVYKSPNLDDYFYTIPANIKGLPVQKTHGSWTQLWGGMGVSEQWIVTVDLCDSK